MIEARLAFIPEYVKRYRKVFGDEWPKVDNTWKAIAAFEHTLIYNNLPFDKFMRGDKSALSNKKKRGLALFKGKANCIECHNGPLLADQKYYNLGIPRAEEWLDQGCFLKFVKSIVLIMCSDSSITLPSSPLAVARN